MSTVSTLISYAQSQTASVAIEPNDTKHKIAMIDFLANAMFKVDKSVSFPGQFIALYEDRYMLETDSKIKVHMEDWIIEEMAKDIVKKFEG